MTSIANSALALCPSCEPGRAARALFFDPQVLTWLAVPTVALALLAIPIALVWRRAPLVAAAMTLGIGLGGFLDGIVFHQLIQWHGMFSSVRPPDDLVTAKLNMIGDGAFHAIVWCYTAAGLALLWRAVKRREVVLSARSVWGGLAIGWGAFNFGEGIVDHQILGIHHVHPGAGELAWDIGFLFSGVALLAGGYLLARRAAAQGSDGHRGRADDASSRSVTTPARVPG